jgi:hypothetical protein
MNGGSGGEGGAAGNSPPGKFALATDGWDGSTGNKGEFISEKISFDEAIKILRKVEHNKFSITNVLKKH